MGTPKKLTNLNKGWGICGFVTALAMLHKDNPGITAAGGGSFVNAANSRTRMLAEIKTFLVTLKAEGPAQMLIDIQEFTRSFGGQFLGFTPDDYIARVDKHVGDGDVQRGDDQWGIGLPPDALVHYLKTITGLPSARLLNNAAPNPGRYIVGVRNVTKMRALYDGLCHYMYVCNGRVYSWGESFPSVTAANPNYAVTHRISM